MMFSKNGVALVILLGEALLSSLGIEFDPGTVSKAVEGTLVAISLCFMIWHQIMERPEIKAFVLKH